MTVIRLRFGEHDRSDAPGSGSNNRVDDNAGNGRGKCQRTAAIKPNPADHKEQHTQYRQRQITARNVLYFALNETSGTRSDDNHSG